MANVIERFACHRVDVFITMSNRQSGQAHAPGARLLKRRPPIMSSIGLTAILLGGAQRDHRALECKSWKGGHHRRKLLLRAFVFRFA